MFVHNRFCIDNGVMIAHTGALMHNSGYKTTWENTFCTQRYYLIIKILNKLLLSKIVLI